MSRWNTKRVFVAYGGESSEREISLRTGQALASALTEAGLAPQLIDVTRATIGALIDARPDVVLVAMHGHLGEDGALQGLLEWMGVPYTGSGVLASALAMDKLRTKQVLVAHNIPTPAWEVWTEAKGEALPALGLPCVVKPSLDGSSVGISLVKSEAEWPAAIAACRAARGAVLVEEQIVGRELTVAIQQGRAMGIIEVMPAEEFYNFDAKYQRGDTRYLFPAPLDETLAASVRDVAERSYAAVGCRGVARVDVMLRHDGAPFVLEVNTVPGMTATSLVPKVAAGIGIPFPAFAVAMLESATTDAAALGQGGQP